jgi:hypothetical protein
MQIQLIRTFNVPNQVEHLSRGGGVQGSRTLRTFVKGLDFEYTITQGNIQSRSI